MKRYHLIEIHDLRCFPDFLRNCVTDFLSIFLLFFRPYKVIEKRLQQAVEEAEATRIIDLCSGGAQPILDVEDMLTRDGKSLPIIISDKYPNTKLFTEIAKKYPMDRAAF